MLQLKHCKQVDGGNNNLLGSTSFSNLSLLINKYIYKGDEDYLNY